MRMQSNSVLILPVCMRIKEFVDFIVWKCLGAGKKVSTVWHTHCGIAFTMNRPFHSYHLYKIKMKG